MNKLVEKVMKALENNNMQAFYFENSSEAVPEIIRMIEKEKTVAFGGSATVFETGLYSFLKENGYSLYDRFEKNITREQVEEIFRKSFYADYYITSSNAITEDGFLFNVDGNGNRVAAMIFGPKEVFVIAGINKLVKDVEEAKERVKTVAAPKNTKRLSCDTYCNNEGKCVSCGEKIGYGCSSKDRICADYVLMGRQRNKRIKVFIINEELGF